MKNRIQVTIGNGKTLYTTDRNTWLYTDSDIQAASADASNAYRAALKLGHDVHPPVFEREKYDDHVPRGPGLDLSGDLSYPGDDFSLGTRPRRE